jgi:hypothetical protein
MASGREAGLLLSIAGLASCTTTDHCMPGAHKGDRFVLTVADEEWADDGCSSELGLAVGDVLTATVTAVPDSSGLEFALAQGPSCYSLSADYSSPAANVVWKTVEPPDTGPGVSSPTIWGEYLVTTPDCNFKGTASFEDGGRPELSVELYDQVNPNGVKCAVPACRGTWRVTMQKQ